MLRNVACKFAVWLLSVALVLLAPTTSFARLAYQCSMSRGVASTCACHQTHTHLQLPAPGTRGAALDRDPFPCCTPVVKAGSAATPALHEVDLQVPVSTAPGALLEPPILVRVPQGRFTPVPPRGRGPPLPPLPLYLLHRSLLN